MNKKWFSEKFSDSAVGFFWDKFLSVCAGIAGALIWGIAGPFRDSLFGLYKPMNDFIQSYIIELLIVIVLSIIFWIKVWKTNETKLYGPYLIAILLLTIVTLMRREVLPNVVGAQFTIFFASLLLLFEALALHLFLVLHALFKS